MADAKLYMEDPALVSVETEVVEAGEIDGRPFVRLAETVFHPEGGGQPADRGTVGGVGVVDVRSRGEEVLHFLARPVEAGRVVAEIDPAWRLDLAQQHTAQHLLTAILLARHGLPTTAFHLGESYTAIEVDGPVPSREELLGFEEEVNREIRADRPVRTVWAERGDLEKLGVRSRGLPDDHEGAVRLVEIEGIDLNTCGGTHVTRLAELQAVFLLDAAPARGGARIRFLAGGRVLAALRGRLDLEDRMKGLLDSSPEEFERVIQAGREERKRLLKAVGRLEADLAEGIGESLAAEGSDRVERHLETAGPALLRAAAAAAIRRRPELLLVLTGEDCFLVQAGPEGPEDVSAEGERLRERLGARGGGRGRVYQGTRS